jgi:hypothetical protein
MAVPPAPPVTEEAPNPWEKISDFSKTVVTLASAILALTVTFSANLIGKITGIAQGLLFLSWALLVVAAGFAIASHGQLIGYLRFGVRQDRAILFSNIAFYSLLVSIISFFVFGYFVVSHTEMLPVPKIIEKALSTIPSVTGKQGGKWALQTLKWNESLKAYELLFREDPPPSTVSVTMEATRGQILATEYKP